MGQAREAAALNGTHATRRLVSAEIRQWRRGPAPVHLSCVLGLVLAAPALALAIRPDSAFWTGVLAAGAAAVIVRPAVRTARTTVRRAWPAVLPLSARSRSLAAVLPIVVAAVLVALVVAAATATVWGAPLAVAIGAGGAVGAMLAGAWPVPRDAGTCADSRYRRTSKRRVGGPALQPVVSDLHALVASRMQPRILARTVAPVLLVLPSGMAQVEMLTAAAGLAAFVYAAFLAASLKPFAVQTQRWMASVPLPPSDLVTPVMRSVRLRLAMIVAALAPAALVWLGNLPAVVFLSGLALSLDRLAARGLAKIGTPA